ncbi:hypothetical protein P43SY_002544 [Pythium insidiosum]|uniref:Pentatricopeptide repeat-containing protein n=1 Tax=Pythium insidiosum TaxID=114742 RepID=A0AAD5LU93_PYTIN|nr:hypothetical protein P43SY_002544 [Pythium insidiosum]
MRRAIPAVAARVSAPTGLRLPRERCAFIRTTASSRPRGEKAAFTLLSPVPVDGADESLRRPRWTRRLKARGGRANGGHLGSPEGRVVAHLASMETSPVDFLRRCDEIRASADPSAVICATPEKTWSLVLQNRLLQQDTDGARALLELLLLCSPTSAQPTLWTDLLFTAMRQRDGALSSTRAVAEILRGLEQRYGAAFVALAVSSLINGCVNIRMFKEARFLIRYHLQLDQDQGTALPPQLIGHLASTLQKKRRFREALAFCEEVLALSSSHKQQPQFWIALFQSAARARADPTAHVEALIDWYQQYQRALPGVTDGARRPHFDRVFGAAIQSCVMGRHERLALRLFDVLPVDMKLDENLYVNVLKASRATQDTGLFKDVYRRMVGDNAARSAGFGMAIRLCHELHDVEFLEEVLEDAFTLEEADGGRWVLPLEQYNDALGCFAETKSFDLAKDLFARLLQNPSVTPDHITMVEMVESYREAPLSEVFALLDVFIELGVTPNTHVFTSLLAACGRHRLMNDAMAIADAMLSHGAVTDIKAGTALCFVYATQGHLHGILDVLRGLEAQQLEPDEMFFNVVLDGITATHGIDLCFALFRETRLAGLTIPKAMYSSLIRTGTKVGLVERTLHVAYNMECDGFPLSSEQLLDIIHRCEANAEVTELLRTFLLLHQGRRDDTAMPRFLPEVYDAMIDVLTRFSCRDAIPKVQELARRETGLSFEDE